MGVNDTSAALLSRCSRIPHSVYIMTLLCLLICMLQLQLQKTQEIQDTLVSLLQVQHDASSTHPQPHKATVSTISIGAEPSQSHADDAAIQTSLAPEKETQNAEKEKEAQKSATLKQAQVPSVSSVAPFAPSSVPPPCFNTAFFSLTRRPDSDVLQFASELSEQSDMHVYILAEDDSYDWPEEWRDRLKKVQLVQLHEREPMELSFLWSTGVHSSDWAKGVLAFEKALAFLAPMYLSSSQLAAMESSDSLRRSFSSRRFLQSAPYCHIWFSEDDVFIPSSAALLRIHSRAGSGGGDTAGDTVDLVHTPPTPRTSDPGWLLWKECDTSWSSEILHSPTIWPVRVEGHTSTGGSATAESNSSTTLSVPSLSDWHHGMMNIWRMSARYTRELIAFALTNKRLLFAECCMPTLVHVLEFNESLPDEMVSLVWRLKNNPSISWEWNHIEQQCYPAAHLYHPAKSESIRADLRQKLKGIPLDQKRIHSEDNDQPCKEIEHLD
jgi:hypothetical protein